MNFGAHPASYPMGTGISFPVGKQQEGEADKLVPRSGKCGSIHPLPYTPNFAYII
jgi:hypothetical protein